MKVNFKKVLVYQKGKAVFALNLHPENSYEGCFVPTDKPGKYKVVMSTDDFCFGGFGRIYHKEYETTEKDGRHGIFLYLPSRTAAILIEN